MKPQYVQAVSIGFSVPPADFDGVVHSTFHSAANIRLEGRGDLLTLLASTEIDLPQGIRLARGAGVAFDGMRVGTRVACRSRILSFEGMPLAIDLRTAESWEAHLPAQPGSVDHRAVIDAWSRAWNALNRRQAERGSELIAAELLDGCAPGRPAWVHQLGVCAQTLVKATQQFDLEADWILGPMIGLGPGLTPTGDDLLGGFLIGLRCAAQVDPRRLHFLAMLGRSALLLSAHTNDISRTYLAQAARGHASRALLDLAAAISTGADESSVLHSVEVAARAGHTSGMDAVTGLLLGFVGWYGSLPL